MRRFSVRLMPEAEQDLVDLHAQITLLSGSRRVADRYLERIAGFLASFDLFAERGSLRNDIRPGLRVIGFERQLSVAFIVEGDAVIILRILAGGREFHGPGEGPA